MSCKCSSLNGFLHCCLHRKIGSSRKYSSNSGTKMMKSAWLWINKHLVSVFNQNSFRKARGIHHIIRLTRKHIILVTFGCSCQGEITPLLGCSAPIGPIFGDKASLESTKSRTAIRTNTRPSTYTSCSRTSGGWELLGTVAREKKLVFYPKGLGLCQPDHSFFKFKNH